MNWTILGTSYKGNLYSGFSSDHIHISPFAYRENPCLLGRVQLQVDVVVVTQRDCT